VDRQLRDRGVRARRVQHVVDRAIQVWGAAGVSGDFPLAGIYQGARRCGSATARRGHKILIAKKLLARSLQPILRVSAVVSEGRVMPMAGPILRAELPLGCRYPLLSEPRIP
jgi:hypothetical protein